MQDRILQLYHSLPPPARSVAASMRGLYLRAWRYGPETDRLVEEAQERERWSPAQWTAWREERLGFVLHRAATKVPYYRQHWRQRRLAGDRTSHEVLENWPILEKESIRANPRAFVADECNSRRMFHEHTSGTTGKSLELWWSLSTVRQWYALFEARCRLSYGVSRHDRWAILGGQLITPVQLRRPPFWVWNAALNQLYMSSYHLAPDLLPHYLDALHRYRINYIYGYPSALYELALEAIRRGRRDLKLKVAIANAEPVFGYQRQAIEEAFQCPLRETYGMAEIVAAASECEHGLLHDWPDVGHIEVLNEGGQDCDVRTGDLVSTGLLNADMPLIRYRVGDRVTLSSGDELCACGRTLPLLTSIDGRMDDVLFTSDGRRIGRLDPVFKSELPIREAQIIQETLDRVRVRYVPTGEFTADAAAALTTRMKAHLGNVRIVLEQVDEVPRTANGKFRAVICELPEATRSALTQAAA